MATAQISFEVDAETARAVSAASVEDRHRMQLLLGLRQRELTARPARPVQDVMDEIGRRAAAHGLTPEALEALLRFE
jgi:hypothetical protein